MQLDMPEFFPIREVSDDEDDGPRTPRISDSQYSSLSSRESCLSSGPPAYGAPGMPQEASTSTRGLNSGLNSAQSADFLLAPPPLQRSDSSHIPRCDSLRIHRSDSWRRLHNKSRQHRYSSVANLTRAADGTLESVEELTSVVCQERVYQ